MPTNEGILLEYIEHPTCVQQGFIVQQMFCYICSVQSFFLIAKSLPLKNLNDAINFGITGNIQDDGQDGCQNIQIFEKDKLHSAGL